MLKRAASVNRSEVSYLSCQTLQVKLGPRNFYNRRDLDRQVQFNKLAVPATSQNYILNGHSIYPVSEGFLELQQLISQQDRSSSMELIEFLSSATATTISTRALTSKQVGDGRPPRTSVQCWRSGPAAARAHKYNLVVGYSAVEPRAARAL